MIQNNYAVPIEITSTSLLFLFNSQYWKLPFIYMVVNGEC